MDVGNEEQYTDCAFGLGAADMAVRIQQTLDWVLGNRQVV